MRHTPGPWKVVDRLYVWTDDDVGCEVAKVCDENLDDDMVGQADADARLIAAAPELLAVLRRGSDAVSALEADCDMAGLDCYPARHWWQDADRLIAKAEGRSE